MDIPHEIPKKISLQDIFPFGVLKDQYRFEIKNLATNNIEFRLYSDQYESKDSITKKLLTELENRNLFLIDVELGYLVEVDPKDINNATLEMLFIVNVQPEPNIDQEDILF